MFVSWLLRAAVPILAVALLLTGCKVPGGCAAVDNSRSIVAYQPGGGHWRFPTTAADLALSTDPVNDILNNASIAVGFIADATCDPPTYYVSIEDYLPLVAGESNYYDSYWQIYNSEANQSAEFQRLLSRKGDEVIFTAVLAAPIAFGSGEQPGELTSMSLTGTFSAQVANAAMRQLYPRWRGPGEIPSEAAALAIPVQWHVEAVVDGELRALDTTTDLKLYREQ